MIYTVGHAINYLANLTLLGRDHFRKGIGGSVFQTIEDAQRAIEENNKVGEWTVWGVDADWGVHTKPDSEGGWWHELKEPRRIIMLKISRLEVNSDDLDNP